MNSRTYHRAAAAAIAVIFAVLFASTSATAQVDVSKITASRGTVATGGMIISGTAGAVGAGAKVTVTDKDGKTATTTAERDGSFVIKEINLPEGFDHTIGNVLTVTSGNGKGEVKITR